MIFIVHYFTLYVGIKFYRYQEIYEVFLRFSKIFSFKHNIFIFLIMNVI